MGLLPKTSHTVTAESPFSLLPIRVLIQPARWLIGLELTIIELWESDNPGIIQLI